MGVPTTHRTCLQKSLCPVVICPYICSSESARGDGGNSGPDRQPSPCDSKECHLSDPAPRNTQRGVWSAGSQREFATHRGKSQNAARVRNAQRRSWVATTRDAGRDNAVAKPLRTPQRAGWQPNGSIGSPAWDSASRYVAIGIRYNQFS